MTLAVPSLPVAAGLVVVDRLRATDAAVIHGYRNDPAVARFQSWPTPYATADAATLVTEMGAAPLWRPGWGIQLGVRQIVDDQLVGDVFVLVLVATPWVAELGATIAPRHQGHGHARDAITAVLDAILGPVVNKVIAHVDPRNAASLRLFDRLGFIREGYLAESYRDGDGYSDDVLFGLTASRWRGRPGLVIEVTDRPHPADVAFLADRIREANVSATGIDDGQDVGGGVRDEHGRMVGGLHGHLWGRAAYIADLWVHPDHRRQGMGRRLMVAWEEHVGARGARVAFLTTHMFQAPAFCERLGFRVTGRWDDHPVGHGDLFMQKVLR